MTRTENILQAELGLAMQEPSGPILNGWPADLRALSLTAPWGWCMTRAPEPVRKRVENRSWAPYDCVLPHEWFLLHSGVNYDLESAEWISGRIDHAVPTKTELQASGELGALVAFARVVRVTEGLAELPVAQVKWRMTGDRYGWLLDVRPLEKPVACLGWHKLWRASPPRVSSALVKGLRAAFDEMRLAESPLLEVA